MLRIGRALKSSTNLAFLSTALIVSGGAFGGALPGAGHYVSGTGSIAKASRSLTVKQSSTTGIIDWNSFSVGSRNSVTFDNGSGATLNRVTGTNLSKIAGSLHATGSLYLVNSQGVVVSGTGRIVTGGSFVASSGAISDGSFGSDPLRFRKGSARVVNRGTIVSSGGATLAGNDVADDGTIRAAQVNLYAAKKLAVGGTITARNSDGSGGTVVATGDNIDVTDSARISASGTRGGTVLIGGDVHGGAIASDNFVKRNVATAKITNVAKGARISANASRSTGGNVVIWSDGRTTFQGQISAKGQTAGGFAEVSSRDLLGFEGDADLTSATGGTGTLLLDPYNVTISSSATRGGSISGGVFKPSANSSVLNVSTLENALKSANVDVTTGTSGTQSGDITVSSAITWASDKTLTLNAFHSIAIDAAITNTGSGNLTLRADTTGTGSGTVSFKSGDKINFKKSTGTVSIFYNPSDNPAGSKVNTTSFTKPTNYSTDVETNSSVSDQAIAYMLVNTVFDLQNVQNNSTGDYALGKNVGASATDKWNPNTVNGKTVYGGFIPIDFNGSTEFTGIFNGAGHTISDLFENWTNGSFGLFGVVGAQGVVRSFKLFNVSFSFGSTTIFSGVAVGRNFGLVDAVSASGKLETAEDGAAGGLVGENESSGKIESSSSSVVVSYAGSLGDGDSDYGGLVGQNFGTVLKSDATGAVTDEAVNANVGGLIGFNNGSEGVALVESSFATGTVTGGTSQLGGGSSIGGLIGYNLGAASTKETLPAAMSVQSSSTPPPPGTVIQSYATGAVIDKGQYEYIGGLVGFNDQNGTLGADYATGAVTGGNDAIVGGLVGNNNAIIAGAYASGAVTAGLGDEVGGLAGLNSGAGIAGCWALGNVIAGSADDSDNPRVADAGGLVGRNQTQIIESFAMGNVKVGATTSVSEGATAAAGGLVGVDYGGTLNQVYSVGMVKGGSGATVGGLSGGSGEDVTDGFWDTQTSGVKSSQEGTGMTTAQLQAALPSGFDNTVWAILPKTSFPYLILQTDSFATGKSTGTPEVISGTISGESVNSGIHVGVRVNGQTIVPLAYTSSGANGYYYELVAGGTMSSASDVLAFTRSGTDANRFEQLAKGSLTGFNLIANSLIVVGSATTETSLLSAMEKALGSNTADALYTSGGSFTSGIDLDLDLSGSSFSINHSIDLGSGELQIDSAGTVSEGSSDKITAKRLTGKSDGAAKFTGSGNAITNMGSFSTGGHNFELTDDHSLAVAGTINAGSSDVALTTTGSAHGIAIDAAIEATGEINLVSTGAVTESTSAGAIETGLLNVTADTGITLESKLNKIKKLGTDTTKSGPNKVTL